jgi:hypothetical protein
MNHSNMSENYMLFAAKLFIILLFCFSQENLLGMKSELEIEARVPVSVQKSASPVFAGTFIETSKCPAHPTLPARHYKLKGSLSIPTEDMIIFIGRVSEDRFVCADGQGTLFRINANGICKLQQSFKGRRISYQSLPRCFKTGVGLLLPSEWESLPQFIAFHLKEDEVTLGHAGFLSLWTQCSGS